MVEFDGQHGGSGPQELTAHDTVIRFLDRNDIPLPDGLTLEKIISRGRWWSIDNESFSFRIERHPSGPFSSTSRTDSGLPTPARWHIRKRYTYDLSTNEWRVAELTREFDFNAGLLVDAEFEQLPRKNVWDQALAHARDDEDPEEVLDEQLALTQQMYRDAFEDVPEDHLEEMLAVLEEAFRRRAGMD